MENEKIDWMKKKLEEIFDLKFNQIEENYKNFKKIKKEMKAEYCKINDNLQKVILERNEQENNNNISSLTHSKSTLNTKIIIKPTEKKPDIARSRTPIKGEYAINNSKSIERSKTPVPEKTSLNIKLNKTEKELINDLKNPKTPTRTKIEKPVEKTPIKIVEKKEVKTPMQVVKGGTTKSPLIEIKKPVDKKTPIKPVNERNSVISKEDNKKEELKTNNKQKTNETSNRIDKRESVTKNIQEKKGKDQRKDSTIKNHSETKININTIINKVDIKEDVKNDNEIENKQLDIVSCIENQEKNNDSKNSNDTEKIIEKIEKLNYPKKANDDLNLTNSTYKCLILCATKGFLNKSSSYKLLIINKEIYSVFNKTQKPILEKIKAEFEKRIEELSKYLKEKDNSEVEALMNKQFVPSKVAQSGLNFFNKEEESSLAKKENNPDEILNIFRMIFILLNENYEHIQPNKYIEYLTTKIFPVYKVDSMKTLFVQNLAKNSNYSAQQIISIQKLVDENPKLLSPNDLLKLNKCVSYMAFMLKEIYEFATLKTVDGTYLYQIKESKIKHKELIEKQSKFLLQLKK